MTFHVLKFIEAHSPFRLHCAFILLKLFNVDITFNRQFLQTFEFQS